MEYIFALLLLVILLKYSKEDLKKRSIPNNEFLFPIYIGFLKNLIYFLKIYNSHQVTVYLFCLILVIIFNILLYSHNILGGADFKTNIIIFLIYSPFNTSGLSNLYDVYQFLLIFSIFYLTLPWLNLIINIISYNHDIDKLNLNLNKNELLSIYLMSHIKKFSKITKYDLIITKIPGKLLQGIINLKFSLYFQTKSNYCIIPIITIFFVIILIL